MAKRNLDGARVLLTGASSGIGAELAAQLSAAGCRLLITARRSERLAEVAQRCTECDWLAGDIADASHRDNLLARADQTWSGLDVLINNAGVGAIGPFAEASPERLREIMEVNFFAPVELTRGALALLAKGRAPLIVNVGSVLGHRAVPLKSEYCASKFAMHGFSDAVRAELQLAGIDVLLVSPSTTRSEFFDRLLEDTGEESGKAPAAMSADKVARKTIKAMRRGRHELILSAGGRLLVWFDRLLPTWADRAVARFAQPRRRS